MKTLVVLLGPTGVGKTALSLHLARAWHTSIVSCDSRQVYREMTIGTAVPSPGILQAVPHYFIQTVSVHDYFSCWQYEQQALALLDRLFRERDVVVMAGGSMLYIDAVCRGVDDMPDVRPEVRQHVRALLAEQGLDWAGEYLRALDPITHARVDLRNGKRVAHALEVCLTTGRPYSSFLTGRSKSRDFDILKIGLSREREELYRRIDRRVDEMIADGLEQEARELFPLRHLNALDTVGYKEWFACFEGRVPRDEAIRLIKRNTRHYARKQLSWFRRDPSIHWFPADDEASILDFVAQTLHESNLDAAHELEHGHMA